MLTSAEHMTYCYSMATDPIYEEHGSDIKFLPCWQLNGCSVRRPFLLAKGVACETSPGMWPQQLELVYVDLMVIRKDTELHAKMFCEVMVQK